jgi:hypothetical protein
MVINLTDNYTNLLIADASKKSLEPEECLIAILDDYFDIAILNEKDKEDYLEELIVFKNFLLTIPCVTDVIIPDTVGRTWFLKLQIDISSPIAWHFVQEFGHILNYISLDERLPTKFYPVSAPPYLNGGPQDFLYWIIEATQSGVKPNFILEYLIGRLPEDVGNEDDWLD